MTTDFSNKVNILGELYQNYRDDAGFADFIEFNDLGLPLAYFVSEGLCDISEEGKKYIEETWLLFLSALEIEDKGFTDLNTMLDSVKK